MKALIAIVAISFSIQSFAYETSLMSSVSSYLTSASLSGQNPFLKAEEVLKDTDAYNLNGDISPALAEHIRGLQNETSELSQAEAIDVLVEQAQKILADK